jgi:hypothetical protein
MLRWGISACLLGMWIGLGLVVGMAAQHHAPMGIVLFGVSAWLGLALVVGYAITLILSDSWAV